MDDNFDISQMFSKAFDAANPPTKKWTPPEGCYPYKELMFTWTRGSIVGVLIPDKNGLPFKTLNRCLYGKVVLSDGSSRKVRWCDNKNYKNLTDEQKSVNDELGKEINRYMELFPDVKPKMRFGSKVSYFYYVVKKIIPEEGESTKYSNPNVTLAIHAASGFNDALKNKIKSTTETFESPAWMKKFFNRNIGDHEDVMNITTTQPGGRGAYQVSFSFDNLPALKVTLDESHLEAANDLNLEFINTNEYDLEYNTESLKLIKALNDGKASVKSLPEVAQPKIDASDGSGSVDVNTPRLF